jgi:hypothetical protein
MTNLHREGDWGLPRLREEEEEEEEGRIDGRGFCPWPRERIISARGAKDF